MIIDVYARTVEAPFCVRCQRPRGGWGGLLSVCTCVPRAGTVVAKVRSVVVQPRADMPPAGWAQVLWQPA